MAQLVFLFLLLTIHATSTAQSPFHRHLSNRHGDVFDVLRFGAVGDGRTDDTQAFKNAWEATCMSSSSSPTMRVPLHKTFLLHPITFSGSNCKSRNIHVQVDGNIVAPSDPSHWNCKHNNNCKQWIVFYEVDGLSIRGLGTIGGQGSKWWSRPCRYGCDRAPTSFVISHSNNVHISDLNFKDSPQMHIAFESSSWVYATNLKIRAPEDSPNTDGIHIQRSTNVFIDRSSIETGDDCISIGDGSSHLHITRILCGPGHGISIGSLGRGGEEETVEYVYVNDVQFTGTSNGVRIKTWQGGRGYARNIEFNRIRSRGSTLPIVIDQFYCAHQNCKKHRSAVHVSNVTYSNIFGTSNREQSVKLACSETVPCTDIFMNNIDIRSTRHHRATTSYCANAHGRTRGVVVPEVPCLKRRREENSQ